MEGWRGVLRGGEVPFFSFMLKRRLMLARMPLPSVIFAWLLVNGTLEVARLRYWFYAAVFRVE